MNFSATDFYAHRALGLFAFRHRWRWVGRHAIAVATGFVRLYRPRAFDRNSDDRFCLDDRSGPVA